MPNSLNNIKRWMPKLVSEQLLGYIGVELVWIELDLAGFSNDSILVCHECADLTKPHEWYPYARLDRRKVRRLNAVIL